jgi:polyisoprenoid-binding protein YceI
MPEKANVRTRAIVAAESRAVRAWRPEQLRECRVYRRMMNAMAKGGPRRIARPAHVMVMRAAFALALSLLVGIACTAEAAQQRIRLGPPESEVAFRAYGLGFVPIDATFSSFDGWLTYDPDDKASCRVELRVQVASLAAEDASLRGKIVGPNFMDAATYPMLTYTGTCEPNGLGGTLAMHGVARPFELLLDWSRNGVVAEGRLVRAEWGMTAMPALGGRTVRIRVAVPLPTISQNAEK